MKKVAVILAGCGYLDGAEIRESVLALWALDAHNAQVQIFAPNIAQTKVMNHLTKQEELGQTRNVLVEAARIARGNIQDLTALKPQDFDALIMPGGFGVAANLATLATEGAKGSVLPQLKQIILAFHQQKKPIGSICIAPAVLALALKDVAQPLLTLGEANPLLEAIGCKQKVCSSDEIAYDAENKIVTCSAYMRDNGRLKDIAIGIEKVIAKVLAI